MDLAIHHTEKLADMVAAEFEIEPMSADGMTAFVAAVHERLEVMRRTISMMALPITWADQAHNLIAGIKGDLAILMTGNSAYANALRSLINALGKGADDSDFPDTARPRVASRIASMTTVDSSVTISGSGCHGWRDAA
uniref:Uncharacterized protein n=1 Tax=Candidatus Kentrum sp. TUN TaxID=2126343 RepID=A0A451AG21_9GAMM|nr:MAG: hypothetical protein BECKTUN1418D_GA0071000_13054 [Candidatus Kentron sp. TUN]